MNLEAEGWERVATMARRLKTDSHTVRTWASRGRVESKSILGVLIVRGNPSPPSRAKGCMATPQDVLAALGPGEKPMQDLILDVMTATKAGRTTAETAIRREIRAGTIATRLERQGVTRIAILRSVT